MTGMAIEDGLATAVASADSGWSVLALFLVCTTVLVWKFGLPLLELVEMTRTNHEVAVEARDKAVEIGDSIQTNHGSKNLGDAVDRLTEEVWGIRDQQAAMKAQLDEHIANSTK